MIFLFCYFLRGKWLGAIAKTKAPNVSSCVYHNIDQCAPSKLHLPELHLHPNHGWLHLRPVWTGRVILGPWRSRTSCRLSGCLSESRPKWIKSKPDSLCEAKRYKLKDSSDCHVVFTHTGWLGKNVLLRVHGAA